MAKISSKFGIVLLHFALAAVVAVIAILIVILGLRNYTQHGVEILVPDVTQLYVEEAKIILESEGLHIEVIDSTYATKVPLGTIVEQNPKANSHVKHGRTIYVIKNANFRKPVILPELRDVSLRQAQASISALGLVIDSIIYEPSAYRDLILDIRKDSLPLLAGTVLEVGTPIQLIVGQGQGTNNIEVPNVLGKTLEEARSWLMAHALTVGIVTYDIPPTEENKAQYIVYSQDPESGTTIVEGSSINLKLSLDIEKTVTADNEQDEEDFF